MTERKKKSLRVVRDFEPVEDQPPMDQAALQSAHDDAQETHLQSVSVANWALDALVMAHSAARFAVASDSMDDVCPHCLENLFAERATAIDEFITAHNAEAAARAIWQRLHDQLPDAAPRELH